MSDTEATFLGRPQRQLLLVAAIGIVLCLVGIGTYFLLRTDYQVLFRDLKPQDASTIVAELEREKIPYRLEGDASSILVPAGDVHGMRLKVMSRELPLKGTVGFELFNNSDLGLTDLHRKSIISVRYRANWLEPS